MAERPRITVVGSFAVGMTIRAPRFPVKGETLPGSDFDMGPGGKGSNQAVGAARLGAESHLVAAIGPDALGQIARDLYVREGVGAGHLREVADCSTGVGIITLDAHGDNHIVIDLGANLRLSPADVVAAEQLIASSAVVNAVLEIPLDTTAHALELARRHGALALLNPAPAQPLPDSLLRHVDVITPNESELRILMGLAPDAGADTLALARALQGRGVGIVVVTRGAQGALVVGAGEPLAVPGVAVDVVDTTGAGDAFSSALAVALGEGHPLAQAVAFACCAGALACTRLGVIPALPQRAAVERLYARSVA
jgi:ribokinase